MSWIEEEATLARQREADKAQQDEIYQRGASGLWSGLRHFLEQHVQQINANQDLVDRVLAGDKLGFQEDGDGITIKKLNFPAIYLTINYRHRYVEVQREIVTNNGERKVRKERIVYNIVIESGDHLVFSNPHGVSLDVADVSQEILTPLLRTHLVK